MRHSSMTAFDRVALAADKAASDVLSLDQFEYIDDALELQSAYFTTAADRRDVAQINRLAA